LDRNILGWEFPVSWVQSINPIFIIILSGVFAAIWTKWGAKQPSTPIKFAAGTVIMGLAFFLFLIWTGGGPNSTPLLAMVGILFVFTVAELLISPVGLSVTTKLAPRKFQAQMVALYFLSVALGTAMAGQLAKLYNPQTEAVYFSFIGGVAVVIGILLAVISPWVLRMMRGVR
ncbi:MAG: MFS transporter, partial [Leifsonia sp.]|nr:MFS transporter [Leifsonia sp.]